MHTFVALRSMSYRVVTFCSKYARAVYAASASARGGWGPTRLNDVGCLLVLGAVLVHQLPPSDQQPRTAADFVMTDRVVERREDAARLVGDDGALEVVAREPANRLLGDPPADDDELGRLAARAAEQRRALIAVDRLEGRQDVIV